jgi:hypothetical protein
VQAARCLAALIVGLVVLAPALPAAGHAFGDPPRAWLSSEGRTVTLDWVAEDDDAAAVGHAIGLLPVEAIWAYIEELPEEQPTPAEIRALSDSADLRAYLLEHVNIRQDGRSCAGVAEPAADFIADGARLRFTCPDPVSQADVRITLLHEEDPAYRTFSVDGSDQLAVHTAAQPEHRWDFTRGSEDPRGPAAVLIVGLVLAVIGAVASLRLLGPQHTTTSSERPPV